MNKPATKEPSMDEILSSIRQIIADDDASVAPPPVPRAAPPARPIVPQAAPAAPSEPLALSPSQIVSRPAPAPMPPAAVAPPAMAPEPEPADFASMLSGLDEPEDESEAMAQMFAAEPELVDPEDIAFEPEPAPVPVPVAPPPVVRAPEPVRAAPPPPRAASVAQAAPMPDPTLSSDMAEQLLAPATDAAVHANMARLSSLSQGGIGGLTVEAMIRDLLRPMLKDWLDENLPSMVEHMVEKEISRISRGVK